MPAWLAATCACKSASNSWGLRGCIAISRKDASQFERWIAPSRTNNRLRSNRPSSSMLVLNDGMEPGLIPPTSAWCPRLATKKLGFRPPQNTGVIAVMSGRCVPPWKGSLLSSVSPGCKEGTAPAATCSSRSRTLSPMEPRCTGICGALATKPPWESNSAQEKSSRSRIFTDRLVWRRRSPICSAIAIKRWRNSSASTGSAGFSAEFSGSVEEMNACSNTKAAARSTRAVQPSSTTMQPVASAIRAGPSMQHPTGNVSRSNKATLCQPMWRRCICTRWGTRSRVDCWAVALNPGG